MVIQSAHGILMTSTTSVRQLYLPELLETLLSVLVLDISMLDLGYFSQRWTFVDDLNELLQHILRALCFSSNLQQRH